MLGRLINTVTHLGGQRRMMNKNIVYPLAVVAVIAALFALFSTSLYIDGRQPHGLPQPPEIPLSQVISMAVSETLDAIKVEGDKLEVTTRDGSSFTSRMWKGASIVEILQSAGVDPLTSRLDITVSGSN